MATQDTTAQVKVNTSLDKFIKENQLVYDLVDYIKKIPNYQLLSNDISILEHILQKIENTILHDKTDKIALAIKIIQIVYPEINIDILNKNIKYFIDNELIKAIPLWKKYKKRVKSFFLNIVSP